MYVQFKKGYADNAAFQDGNKQAEVARILRKVAEKVEAGEDSGSCMDINGNKVGTWSAK